MKPWELLGETRTPDGTLLSLTRRDTELVILAGGKILMSSRMHGSEEAMAEMALKGLRTASAPSVLIGGLGMGFTLRAALDLLPPDASVVVAELIHSGRRMEPWAARSAGTQSATRHTRAGRNR